MIFLTVLSAASGVGGWEDGPDVGGEVGGGGGPGQPELAVAGRPPEAYGVILKNKHEHLNESSNICACRLPSSWWGTYEDGIVNT